MKKLLSILFLVSSVVFGRTQTSPIVCVTNLNALQALPIPVINNSFMAVVKGQSTQADGGYGGLFIYDAADSTTTNVFSVFKPTTTTGRWIRLASSDYNQRSAVTSSDRNTYALRVQRNFGTNAFTIGTSDSAVYLQSWDSYDFHINAEGANRTILNIAGGTVGIGTATTVSKLNIAGGISLIGANTITTSTGNLTLATGGASGHIILTPATGGNVGIGTTSPGSLLTVAGRAQISAVGSPPTGGAGIELYGGANPEISTYDRTGSAYLPLILNSLTHTYRVSGTDAVTISAARNLLIGTTSETGLTGAGGLKIASTTDSLSTTSGSIITAGGVGVAKAAFVGGLLNVTGLLTNVGGSGQTALVAGTKAITVTGVTTASLAFVQLVTPNTTSLTVNYQAVCTANTITIQANVAAGTINTADISTLNYFVVAK